MIYVWCTLISVFFAYCAGNLKRGKVHYMERGMRYINVLSGICYLTAFIPLTFISAVRYDVGTDFFSYNAFYKNRNLFSYAESGFKLLLNILNKFSSNPQLFFIVSSVFIIGCYYQMIYKESINYPYSVLLIVLTNDYFRSMNTVRQYIAMAVVFLAIPYIKKKDWKISLALIVLASCFHMSAIVMVIFYVLYFLDLKPTTYLGLIVGLFIGGTTVRSIVLPLISKYTSYGRYFSTKSRYSSGEFADGFFLIFFSFVLLMTLWYRYMKQSDNLKLLYTACCMGSMISIFSMFMTSNFSRLVYYMNIYIILYVPEMLEFLPNKLLKRAVGFAIILGYMGITVPLILNGNQSVLPYQSIWSNRL